MPSPRGTVHPNPVRPPSFPIPARTLNEMQTMTSMSPDTGVAFSLLSTANAGGRALPAGCALCYVFKGIIGELSDCLQRSLCPAVLAWENYRLPREYSDDSPAAVPGTFSWLA